MISLEEKRRDRDREEESTSLPEKKKIFLFPGCQTYPTPEA
jgi:hypothetical protein